MRLLIHNQNDFPIYVCDTLTKVNPKDDMLYVFTETNKIFHIMSEKGFVEIWIRNSEINKVINIGKIGFSIDDNKIYINNSN